MIATMKPTVYIETTIPSYLTAWPSRDLVRAGQQQTTREWWDQRTAFDICSSWLVLSECEDGDPTAAAARLAAMAEVPIVGLTADAALLAVSLVRDGHYLNEHRPMPYTSPWRPFTVFDTC